MNLSHLAEDSLQRHGERPSLHFEGAMHTNAAILDRARRLQRALLDLGIRPGDFVAMVMVNHPMVHSVFQAIFRTGAAAVPIMYPLTPPEMRFMLEDTKSRGVITDSTVLYKVREATKDLPHVEWILVRGGKDDATRTPREIRLESLLEAIDPAGAAADVAPDDLALLLYTSGTTGRPKGAMLSHANLIFSATVAAEAAEYHRFDRPQIGLTALPLAHMFGVGVMNSAYMAPDHMAGGYSVLMQWFQPEAFLKLIAEHKVNQFAGVPTMLALLLNDPSLEKYDVSSVDEVIVGGAPLPIELARRFMDRFGCRVREGYGMTENAAMCTINPGSQPYVPGSVGIPYRDMEVAIHDDDDRPVPAGRTGEIVCRGPAVMQGYYNRPEANAETLRGGWLHTGDVGRFDEEGRLYVVDRKKDMIIRGGENLYPAEIEQAIYAHPGVAEAAVVGVPDPVHGEDVVAFVVRRPGADFSEADLIAHLQPLLAKIKIPRRVIFDDRLPKSGVGKILRRELRERA